jgi:hypothetical protein
MLILSKASPLLLLLPPQAVQLAAAMQHVAEQQDTAES